MYLLLFKCFLAIHPSIPDSFSTHLPSLPTPVKIPKFQRPIFGAKSQSLAPILFCRVTYVSAVYGVVHDVHPALEGGDLEEGEVGQHHVVKRDPEHRHHAVLVGTVCVSVVGGSRGDLCKYIRRTFVDASVLQWAMIKPPVFY